MAVVTTLAGYEAVADADQRIDLSEIHRSPVPPFVPRRTSFEADHNTRLHSYHPIVEVRRVTSPEFGR